MLSIIPPLSVQSTQRLYALLLKGIMGPRSGRKRRLEDADGQEPKRRKRFNESSSSYNSGNDLDGNKNIQCQSVWKWMEDDGTWYDYDANTQLLIENLPIGNTITFKRSQWTYIVTKASCCQCSLSTFTFILSMHFQTVI